MGWKQSHKQEKQYLEENARIEKFLSECCICHSKGYNPEKIEERNEEYFRKHIKKHYRPLELDESGRCKVCAEREG